MLFTYKYIPQHNVYKLQEYLDFLFKEVWLKAEGEFDVSKLDGFQKLKQIYIDLGNVDFDPADKTNNKRGKFAYFFNSSIVEIYNEFAKLDEDSRAELAKLYDNNNDIEGLCSDKSIQLISYKDLKAKHSDLEKVLKKFYDALYGNNSPFNLRVFGFLNKVLIQNHYEEFMKKNTEGICPFCGIHTIKENNHSYREAYDHYIPKGIYPFISLNFKNLAPMCQECNSTYKGRKVPIENDANERKLAFYPYAKVHPKLKFEVKLKSKNILELKPKMVDINVKIETDTNEINTLKKGLTYYINFFITKLIRYFIKENNQNSLQNIKNQSDLFEEEIASWKRVFGIEERYKALICNKSVGIYWYQSIIDEFENASIISGRIKSSNMYRKHLRLAKNYPLSDYGFLKKEFIEECKRKGLINANA